VIDDSLCVLVYGCTERVDDLYLPEIRRTYLKKCRILCNSFILKKHRHCCDAYETYPDEISEITMSHLSLSLSLLFQDFLNLKDLLDCWTLIHTSYNTCVLFIGPYYFALLSLSLISSFVCVVVVAGRERERERGEQGK